MKLIITEKDGQVLVATEATEENEQSTLPEAIAYMLSGMHGMCAHIINEADEAEIQELHDYMTGVFSLFMERVFPGRAEFGLSDAALIKAQDDIIAQAIKDGKSVEEAVAEYNQKAEDYFKELKDVRPLS